MQGALNKETQRVVDEVRAAGKSPELAKSWNQEHETKTLFENLPLRPELFDLRGEAGRDLLTVRAATNDPDTGSIFDPEGEHVGEMTGGNIVSKLVFAGIGLVSWALMFFSSIHNFVLGGTTIGSAFTSFTSIFTSAAWLKVGAGLSLMFSGLFTMLIVAAAAFVAYNLFTYVRSLNKSKRRRKK